MAIPDNIVKMDKCFKCRCNSEELCEGQYAIKGSTLQVCPYYIDYRSTKSLQGVKVPYPKISKKRKKNKTKGEM